MCYLTRYYPPLKRKYNADIDILQIDLVYISPLLARYYLASRIGFRFPRDVVYDGRPRSNRRIISNTPRVIGIPKRYRYVGV